MPRAGCNAWRCVVCGYVHAGKEPPDSCPVCGATSGEFEPNPDMRTPAVANKAARWQCADCGCVQEGDEPPSECPVCGASTEKFEALSGPAVARVDGVQCVVIVGGGVAAVSAAETVRKASPDSVVTLVAREPELPYYRLNLTQYLAGDTDRATLPIHPVEWYAERKIDLIIDAPAETIDVAGRRIVLEDGRELPYGRLLLATGSHPFIPPIPGVHKQGVFTLRTVADTDAILARAAAGARCVCIGGGVLGIEAAGALARQGTAIVLLESHDWLMPRQLNGKASGYLERYMSAIGVEVLKNARTKEICGGDAVSGVLLHDGRRVDADVVILATGVRPNTALARKAGIEVNEGIVVDNHLRTSVDGIFAAGDAAEHNTRVYGSWAASQYQGGIAGLNMVGVPAVFGGLPRVNTIKALGLDITSIGAVTPQDGSYTVLEQEEPKSYVSFVFRDGRIVGAMLVGRAELAVPVKKAVESAAVFADLLGQGITCADAVDRLRSWYG